MRTPYPDKRERESSSSIEMTPSPGSTTTKSTTSQPSHTGSTTDGSIIHSSPTSNVSSTGSTVVESTPSESTDNEASDSQYSESESESTMTEERGRTDAQWTITAAAVVVSAAGYGGIISLYHYIFASHYVFTTKVFPQLWRIFTAFLITKPKFGILLDPYFLYQYGSSIERESSRFSQPGDFFVYTMFLASVIAATAGGILNQYTFLPALSLAYAYTFAQDNPTRSVSFFIITFESKYLPFAMLFMTFIIDGPDAAAGQLTGLIAAHLYDFLTRIWPTFGGGTNYIRTPQMVKGWFSARPGSVQDRGFGHVVEGRGRTAGAAGSGAPPSAARATGNAWGGMGPGRRLGE
ncbi:unnamed protein product [Alternaria alternata]